MEYNSQKDELIISEYGRNVQNLIRMARDIEDVEERQAFVEKVVELMIQMSSQSRSMEDYREKVWKDVFEIAEYNLPGVVPPDGVIPKPEERRKKPEKIPYPKEETRFRHYGHNVQKLIAKAIEMEPGPIRDAFVEVIASYMKLAYKTWNKEHYVSDELILADLESLSEGKIKIELQEGSNLDNLSQAQPQVTKKRRRSSSQPQGNGNKNGNGHQGQNKSGGRSGGRYRRRRK